MPRFSLQHRIVVSGRTFFLDAACEEVQLAVEMDGAAWHGSPDQRERDIPRDALLATVGWQTLRFSFTRLTGSPQGCRHEIRAVHAARLTLIRPHRAHRGPIPAPRTGPVCALSHGQRSGATLGRSCQ
jgi:very-short-patch-repair endonuclease